MSFVKGVISKTTSPTVNDDSSKGFYVGFMWVNTTDRTVYECYSNSLGAAVWGISNGNITVDSTVTASSHTGTTNEFILGTLTIPSGIFIANDKLIIDFLYNTLGTNGAKEFKVYINSSTLLDGSEVQLGRINTPASVVGGRFLRNYSILNSTTLMTSTSASNNLNTDYVNNGTYTDFTTNLALLRYIIITGTLANGADTVLFKSALVIRNRK